MLITKRPHTTAAKKQSKPSVKYQFKIFPQQIQDIKLFVFNRHNTILTMVT